MTFAVRMDYATKIIGLPEGHTVKIHEADGTVTVQHFTFADGAIILEPDVRAFPNSDAVNKTLRSIIALVPAKGKRHARSSR